MLSLCVMCAAFEHSNGRFSVSNQLESAAGRRKTLWESADRAVGAGRRRVQHVDCRDATADGRGYRCDTAARGCWLAPQKIRRRCPIDGLTTMNQLEQLKTYTTVVADTGDFRQLAQFSPRDATTNPSLIFKAARLPDFAPLLAASVAAHAGLSLDELVDRVLVRFGLEILARIPGRVSTEVDARLSFDRDATVARARRLIALYAAEGVGRDRVLIKIASTWEGIQAAAELERDGVRCNLTLLFAFCQAVACGHAGVTLISPFVGRIYDWHRNRAGHDWDESARAGSNDPGVQSVTRIYTYFRRHGIATQVMGASFRNVSQIQALAGCDLLTISPELLQQLQAIEAPLARTLDPRLAAAADLPFSKFDEAAFRFALNDDAMATEKLAEGIRLFAADTAKLESLITALR